MHRNSSSGFEIHQTLGIRHGNVIIGMKGHGRAPPAASLKPGTGSTGFDIQISQLKEYRRVIAHVFKARDTHIADKKGLFLHEGAGVYIDGW